MRFRVGLAPLDALSGRVGSPGCLFGSGWVPLMVFGARLGSPGCPFGFDLAPLDAFSGSALLLLMLFGVGFARPGPP